jgi:hypothetical protein
MYLDPERCIKCGIRIRSTTPFSKYITNMPSVDETGSIIGTPYWFCSERCFKSSLSKHIDPEYDLNKKASDTSEWHDSIRELGKLEDTSEHWAMAKYYFSNLDTKWRGNQREAADIAHQIFLREIAAEENYKLLETQQKADALARKEAEKRAEQEAEEARWRPKPFKV